MTYQVWANSISRSGRVYSVLLDDAENLDRVGELAAFYKSSDYGKTTKLWVQVDISVACLIPQ